MKIVTNSIDDKGYFKEKFGKHGSEFLKDMPSHSIDFEIKDAPKEAKSFAFILDDHDAIPVCGFTWIHWAGANLKKTKVEEGEALNTNDFIQGVNSWWSPLFGDGALSREEAANYGGMAPPDCEHIYELRVYALDCELNLENGFYVNELYNAIKGHVIEMASVEGKYKN